MQAAYVEPAISPTPYLNQIIVRTTTVASTHRSLPEPTVYLVSANEQVHREVTESMEDLEIRVVSFFSEVEYLSTPRHDAAGCLVLDMELCGASGLEVQRRLLPGLHPPIIFVSSSCNIRSTVSAMKSGAIDFLTRPVDPQALAGSIRMAFQQDYRRRQKKIEQESLHQRLSLLTPREREVLRLVAQGHSSQGVAAILEVSPRTVETHRQHIMRKLGIHSVAGLTRFAMESGNL